jgi:hypothetical protein
MIVSTVPIVPLRRNRLTYAVLWGTLPTEVIVPPSSPKEAGTMGGRSCIPIVPHLFGLSMRVSW